MKCVKEGCESLVAVGVGVQERPVREAFIVLTRVASIQLTMSSFWTACGLALGSLPLFASAAPARPFRGLCQHPDNHSLRGCPKNTVVVKPHGKFESIQQAILSIPANDEPFTVLIYPGTYTEQLNITRQGPLTLLGVTSSPNNRANNQVNVVWHNATGTPETGSYDNAYTSVLTVAPTLEASFTGSGPTGYPLPADTAFGNMNFRAYNLNFINDYLPYSAGPSLALSLSYANGGFYFTRFLSYQDTVRYEVSFPAVSRISSNHRPRQVYIGKLGNAYMYESEIGGQTDFFYGFGTCWVTDSIVSMRGCGGGITAWKGMNTSFENKYGVYIHDSVVQKANASLEIARHCALGRPWNAQHRSIFANSYLDDSIRPSGYIEWGASDPRINHST